MQNNKDVLILSEGKIPDRWIAEAKKRIAANATTQLVERNPDVVVFFSDGLVRLSELTSRFPHAALLIISPAVTEISTSSYRDGTSKYGHLPSTPNSPSEIIGALSDLKIIPDASFKL